MTVAAPGLGAENDDNDDGVAVPRDETCGGVACHPGAEDTSGGVCVELPLCPKLSDRGYPLNNVTQDSRNIHVPYLAQGALFSKKSCFALHD